MNRHRFKSDMEAAWELRPGTDETPSSGCHSNRFAVMRPEQAKTGKKHSESEKKRDNGR
jgi:hypothetical protein